MVIDTDGSAFITKAEFDSLKNNFQSQIDNYNSSIDSKIDGAIASYLAGVRVSRTGTQNTLLDLSSGVLCVAKDSVTTGTAGSYRPGSIPWTYGNLGFDFSGQITKLSQTAVTLGEKDDYSSMVLAIKRDPGVTKERLIKNWDATNHEAIWVGYVSTNNKIKGSSTIIKTTTGADRPTIGFSSSGVWSNSASGDGTEGNPYMLYTCWDSYPYHKDPISGTVYQGVVSPIKDDRIPLDQKSDMLFGWCFNSAQNSGGTWADKTCKINTNLVGSSFYYDIPVTGLNFQRNIVSKAHPYIIVCDNSQEQFVHRISDNDVISGFCSENEDEFNYDLSIPTSMSMANFLGSGITIISISVPQSYREVNTTPIKLESDYTFRAKLAPTATTSSCFKVKVRSYTTYTRSTGTQLWYRKQRPTFGFLDDVNDWKMLANDFESVLPIADIVSTQPSGEVAYTDANNKTLMIGAGMPLLKVEKNVKYVLSVKPSTSSATGEIGNYHIWFKMGTFTKDTAPDNENNLLFDTSKTLVSGKKCYEMIPNQSYEFTFEPDKNGYIFCKWQNAAIEGGGILTVDRVVQTFSDN